MFSIVMWSVWGAIAILFVIIKIYMMGLSKNEDDQLVLQESTAHVLAEQAEITAGLDKVEPLRRAVMWMLVAMTLVVMAYYIVDMVKQFQ